MNKLLYLFMVYVVEFLKSQTQRERADALVKIEVHVKACKKAFDKPEKPKAEKTAKPSSK